MTHPAMCRNRLHEMTADNQYLMHREARSNPTVRCRACYERCQREARARKAEARRVARNAEAAADAWRRSELAASREREIDRLRAMVAREATAQRARNATRRVS